jgi:4-amino-4-deoxy-L-arabinose transferase-like glycosyltransferase
MRQILRRAATSAQPGKTVRKRPRSEASDGRPASRRRSKSFSSPWAFVPVFLVAVGLRVVHVQQMRHYAHFNVPVLDAAYFDDWARRIAAGDWLGKDIFFVDPLYAYFLGAIYKIFGPNIDAVRWIQAAIGGISAVLIQLLGIRLLGGPAGFLCGMIAACYRPFIFYDGLLLKAVLKVPLTTLFLYFAVGVVEKARHQLGGLLSGFFLGLAALVRGNMLVMAPVTAAAFMFMGKVKTPARLWHVLLFALGIGFVIAPVAFRNQKVGGEWVLTASGMGQNMYIGNHPDNPSGSYVGPPFTRPNPDYEEIDYRAEAERRTGLKMTPSQVSRFWARQTLEVIADNPWRWIALEGRKIWLLTHSVEIPDNYSFDFETRFSWVLRLPFPAFAIIFPFGLAGIIAAVRDRKRTGLRFLVLFLAIYSLSLLPFFIISRYKVPLIPALIVLAVYGAGALLTAWKNGEWKYAAVITAVVLGTGLYTRQSTGWIPISEIHFNFGTEFRERGLLKKSEEQFREAIRIDPNYAEAYNNLAAVVVAQGRREEAEKLFEIATRLKPGYWEAEYNQADLDYRAGRVMQAIPRLERILARKPDFYEATLLLGLARKRTGKTDEALLLLRKARALKAEAIEAPYNEAMLLKELGRAEEARQILTELNRRHPSHEPTRRALEQVR